uniref:phage tail protein n=1 Tax=Bilophila wadsworthia TaxID=35833 RepID=UPI002670E5DA
MAEATLQGIWTQKGLDKETAFRAGEERKKLTHVAVGDGNGTIPLVSAAQTGLVNEVWRGLANAVMVNPDDPTDLLVDAVIPNSVGGFWIREWGIFDEDGDLVAVGPHDEMHKPLISTGQAAEFIERFHLPSANATFVEIKITSQALATQQYVESKMTEHDVDLGAHETLARKSIRIKPGTGLTGGGTLEADLSLTVKYGNAAGTACQGNDVRLADARTPKPHKATHQTGGTDALTPADIGAAAKTVQIKAGTGLSGGGTLENNIELSMKLDGKTTQADAGGAITVKDVAIGGNLGDLASARGQVGDYVSSGFFDFNSEILDTKNVFFGHTGSTNMPFPGSSAVQVKSRGYADYKWIAYLAQNCGYIASPRAAIKSSYTEDGGVTYATAGWSKLLDEKHVGDGLTVTNGIISVPEYEGATASTAGTSGLVPPATAGQQDMVLTGSGEWAVPPAETFRLSMIGKLFYDTSDILLPGFIRPIGDLVLFEDWPEFKKRYDAGAFNNMLLPHDASQETIAANIGKWRKNAANPTGLFSPNLSGQFFRAWTLGAGREAGAWQGD